MTFREKLADWISGGKLSFWKDEFLQVQFDLHVSCRHGNDLYVSIKEIHTYTSPQKSGTAKKVTRMCNEALK